MREVQQLKQLLDFGIPINVLARECHCNPASISNYVKGQSLPNGSKILAIKDGLRHIIQTLNDIIKE